MFWYAFEAATLIDACLLPFLLTHSLSLSFVCNQATKWPTQSQKSALTRDEGDLLAKGDIFLSRLATLLRKLYRQRMEKKSFDLKIDC